MFYNFRPNNTGDCYIIKTEQSSQSHMEILSRIISVELADGTNIKVY
ncbi:hypothetical protein [Nostoc sp.]